MRQLMQKLLSFIVDPFDEQKRLKDDFNMLENDLDEARQKLAAHETFISDVFDLRHIYIILTVHAEFRETVLNTAESGQVDASHFVYVDSFFEQLIDRLDVLIAAHYPGCATPNRHMHDERRRMYLENIIQKSPRVEEEYIRHCGRDIFNKIATPSIKCNAHQN